MVKNIITKKKKKKKKKLLEKDIDESFLRRKENLSSVSSCHAVAVRITSLHTFWLQKHAPN